MEIPSIDGLSLQTTVCYSIKRFMSSIIIFSFYTGPLVAEGSFGAKFFSFA